MKTARYILAVLLTLAAAAHAEDPFASARGKAKIGDTLDQCSAAIGYRELPPDEATTLLNRHPWVETHCFLLAPLKAGRVVVWTDDKKEYLGWPIYVFGTFSEDGKLTDLIGSHYGYTAPLVPGTYSTRVANIRRGMNVSEMYELVGRRYPTYRKDENGKWIVEFTYESYPGQFHHIEAEAATGLITIAVNATI